MADLAHILKKTEQRSKALPKSKQVVRIADGPRPYEEEAKAFARELEAKNQPGTKPLSTGDNDPPNRGQELDLSPVDAIQPGTKPLSTGDNEASNRGQELGLSPVEGVSPSAREHSATVLSEIVLSTGDKTTLVPGSIDACPRLDEPLSPVEAVSNRGQIELVPGSIDACPRLDEPLSPVVKTINRGQTESQPGTKLFSTGDTSISNRGQPLPSSRQQLLILSHLIAVQEATGLGHTQRLSRAELAASLNVTCDVLKRQLQRMIDASIVVRLEAKDGRHEGGTVYQISRETIRAFGTLNRGQTESQPGTKQFLTGDISISNRGHQPGTNHTLVSSSFNNSNLKTTTTDRDRADRFQDACERFELSAFKIDGNVMLDAWRKGAFSSEDDLLLVAERLAFHLNSPDLSKGLTNQRAWFAKKLEQAAFAEPVGFKSWAERQAEAMLAAKHAQVARLEDLRRQELDADFEIWFHTLGADEKRRRLKGMVNDDDQDSKRARMILRDEFLKERGQESA